MSYNPLVVSRSILVRSCREKALWRARHWRGWGRWRFLDARDQRPGSRPALAAVSQRRQRKLRPLFPRSGLGRAAAKERHQAFPPLGLGAFSSDVDEAVARAANSDVDRGGIIFLPGDRDFSAARES